eukprot:TRINITY_DN19794_c0_g3_i1.p1 TRINITY_DN19794_c0_g3~~TRINITY_DN19794_c0_g3_i1.p1  ORF type:complete len:264 (-),score=52.88 TRINITY_DN19794_c0_g3_i1:104-895(-)
MGQSGGHCCGGSQGGGGADAKVHFVPVQDDSPTQWGVSPPTSVRAEALPEPPWRLRIPDAKEGGLLPEASGTLLQARGGAKCGREFPAGTELAPAAKALGAVPGGKERDEDLFNTLASTMTSSPFSTLVYEEMTKDQRHEARSLIKEFVRTMVKGRRFQVLAASGATRRCFCSLGRKLDKLRISAGENDAKTREVLLTSILDVQRSEEEDPFREDLTATLYLDCDQTITFLLRSIEDRDMFVTCLTMLTSQAKQVATRSHTLE